MYFNTITAIANDFTDESERHELVIGARVCKQCISCLLISWLQLQINILFFENSRAILRRLKLKKTKNEPNFWVIHCIMKNVTQIKLYECCFVTLVVSRQLSASRNGKNFNEICFIKYCFFA